MNCVLLMLTRMGLEGMLAKMLPSCSDPLSCFFLCLSSTSFSPRLLLTPPLRLCQHRARCPLTFLHYQFTASGRRWVKRRVGRVCWASIDYTFKSRKHSDGMASVDSCVVKCLHDLPLPLLLSPGSSE